MEMSQEARKCSDEVNDFVVADFVLDNNATAKAVRMFHEGL